MIYCKQEQQIPYEQKLVLVYELDSQGQVVQIAHANTAVKSYGLLECPFKMRLSNQRACEVTSREYFDFIGNGAIFRST